LTAVHRSNTSFASRLPGRVQPHALALHRRGVAKTYELHDRLLSNRRARSLYSGHRPSLDGVQRRIVEELERQGFALASFAELFGDEAWARTREHAAEFIGQTEHGLSGEASGEGGADLRRRAGKEFLVRKYDQGAVLGLDDPWLVIGRSRQLVDVASGYLQLWPKLEYVDVWYSIPQPGAKRTASQLWHRDFDDRHLLKAFLYLIDVDAEAGPFEYVPGSQPGGRLGTIHPWAPMGVGRISEEEIARHVPPEDVQTFTAPAGTIIFCNTSGLHRGGFAQGKPRVLAAFTYCSPASLASLTKRNYSLAPSSDTTGLDPVVRYALT
jgi:hypothetical protein